MKKTIKAILILIMIMVVCMTVIACDKPNLEDEELPEEAEELTRTQIITNGTLQRRQRHGQQEIHQRECNQLGSGQGSLSKASDGVICGAGFIQKERLKPSARPSIPTKLWRIGHRPPNPQRKDDPEKLQDTNALILASTNSGFNILQKHLKLQAGSQ